MVDWTHSKNDLTLKQQKVVHVNVVVNVDQGISTSAMNQKECLNYKELTVMTSANIWFEDQLTEYISRNMV